LKTGVTLVAPVFLLYYQHNGADITAHTGNFYGNGQDKRTPIKIAR
jgi:hypothetical protein